MPLASDATLLKSFVRFSGREKILSHVPTPAERRLEFLEDEENFAVVSAGFVCGFDVNRADLPCILASIEIGTGAVMRVIEAIARGVRCENDAAMAMRGNVGSSFLSRTIYVCRNFLTMPMQLPQENTSWGHFWPVFGHFEWRWPSGLHQQRHALRRAFRPQRLGSARHASAIAGRGDLQPEQRLCAIRFFAHRNALVSERRNGGERTGHRAMVRQ